MAKTVNVPPAWERETGPRKEDPTPVEGRPRKGDPNLKGRTKPGREEYQLRTFKPGRNEIAPTPREYRGSSRNSNTSIVKF